MIEQPTPNVDFRDVDRILERDFLPKERNSVRMLIEASQVHDNARVVLACLKISDGNASRAEAALKSASVDWRDVVTAAEYPNYAGIPLVTDDLSAEERRRIHEEDWRQYSTWLNAG